jgi:hypothetical protein
VLEALKQLSEASRTKNINHQRTYNPSGEKTTVRGAPYKKKLEDLQPSGEKQLPEASRKKCKFKIE